MSFDADATASDAARAFATYGAPAYLVRAAAGDPADPLSQPGAVTLQPVTAIYANQEQGTQGANLQAVQRRKVLIAAATLGDFRPRLSDRFRETEEGSDLYLVPPLTVLAPTGVPLVYTLTLQGP